MTYVIAEPCINEKAESCVEVCPAACIHTTPDASQNYIDPDVCIECEQCVLVCPVNAIFLDEEVPPEWQRYIAINADFFRDTKDRHGLSPERAARMVEAVRAYARRAGIAAATVVLDGTGERVLWETLDGADGGALDQAGKKAYTAFHYRLGTHQLQPGRTPRGVGDVAVDPERVLMVPGGLPVVEGGVIVGAIGVAGSPSVEQDVLCCQAGLAALAGAGH